MAVSPLQPLPRGLAALGDTAGYTFDDSDDETAPVASGVAHEVDEEDDERAWKYVRNKPSLLTDFDDGGDGMDEEEDDDDDDDDETARAPVSFAAELDEELTATMASLHAKMDPVAAAATGHKTATVLPNSGSAADADSDDEAAEAAKQGPPVTDELFFDPDADDEDQKWVDRQRGRYLGYRPAEPSEADATNRRRGIAPAATSDAVLNCPACMTALCLDCQQHELYPTQFRAMFTLNTRIDMSERLAFRESHSAQRKRKGKGKKAAADEEADLFYPVVCTVCNTVVAMYDADEVYHFFNVLASAAS